jgi:hypothetical protein
VRRLLIIALAIVAALGIVSSASASNRDRNHDRLPDRWERAHHLSLKVKQAKRDQDRDGLNNRGEWRSHSDPRDNDSDDDGIKDGDENAGTIKSFVDGVLTITLAEGGDLAAKVDGDTEIECHSPGDLKVRSSSEGPGHHGDDDGPNHDADDDHGDDGPNHDVDDDHGDDNGEHGDKEDGDDRNEHGDDDNDKCGIDALKEGTRVHEAELEITSKGKHWEELELIPAA